VEWAPVGEIGSDARCGDETETTATVEARVRERAERDGCLGNGDGGVVEGRKSICDALDLREEEGKLATDIHILCLATNW